MRIAVGIVAGLLAGVTGVALFGWLLWWLWKRDEEPEAPAIEIAAGPVSLPSETKGQALELGEEDDRPEDPDQSDAEEPDDLKRIEGIGPKISGVLYEAGISTFAQLADADEGQLESILREADPRLLRLAKPTTWPEQAALAAAGQWEALEALQGELKGGRRA